MPASRKGSPRAGPGPPHCTPHDGIPRTPWLGSAQKPRPCWGPRGAPNCHLPSYRGDKSPEGRHGCLGRFPWTGHTPGSRTSVHHGASGWPGPQAILVRISTQHKHFLTLHSDRDGGVRQERPQGSGSCAVTQSLGLLAGRTPATWTRGQASLAVQPRPDQAGAVSARIGSGAGPEALWGGQGRAGQGVPASGAGQRSGPSALLGQVSTALSGLQQTKLPRAETARLQRRPHPGGRPLQGHLRASCSHRLQGHGGDTQEPSQELAAA